MDGRTPVLVGAAAVQQHTDNPLEADDAAHLMADAVQGAAADANAQEFLARAQLVAVPKGTWAYRDAGHLVAQQLSMRHARTAAYELGVLQQSLVARACQAIAHDGLDVAVICGAEAKYRDLRAAILGVDLGEVDAPTRAADDRDPDDVVKPADDILHRVEISRMLPVPARQYAVIESALRAADGMSVDDHRHELARLWAGFSAVAERNPDAWNRSNVDEPTLLGANSNPMLATPYTKLHCSQWNVNQGAAVIVCSVDAATELGIARDRWVFPHALAESNFMTPLVTRAAIHRNHAMHAVGERLRKRAGIAPADCDVLDLYSCFPSAVRLQLRELGIEATRQLTVTGGMTFGGGPLNNYTLQSLVKMCELLREQPEARGLVTAVSGIVTKFAGAIWSCQPPEAASAIDDVSDVARAATELVAVDPDYEGDATVAGFTVVHEHGTPTAAVAVVDTPSGDRSVATSTDPALAAAMASDEWIGRTVTVRAGELHDQG
ncbi:MAG TPA: acetyl-CoA acetyltransferase [Acidimicrobiia bacterium]|jgi:acetyl-CoA C-acetyltransferase